MTTKKPVCLIIFDGWGYREETKDNAIAEAKTPYFDSLWEKYPHTLLNASEEYVGLPKGQIGNSETGHMTMGTGRTIDVDLIKVNKAGANGEFDTNPAFIQLFDHVKKYNSTLHVIGMIGPGGVHSHQDHLHYFLKAAKTAGIEKIAIHVITDGRDLPPQSAAHYLRELEDFLADLGIGFIATAHGRFYAMDRDKNWDRLAKTEAGVFEGKGPTHRGRKPSDVIAEIYKEGIGDEYIEPMVFLDDDGKSWPISRNDGLFFFNFRSDRARQFSEKALERKNDLNLCFVTLTEYDKNLPTIVAFPQQDLSDSLSETIAKAGRVQSHIAETEKYAHVTYFFNGGREEKYVNEHFFMIDSRHDIPTHDLAPEMRAREIAEKTVERINAGDDFLVVNFANADVVGHTANKPAVIATLEVLDEVLKTITEAVLARGGATIMTADHGNAELNIDPKTGERHTAHTTNVVPCIVIANDTEVKIKKTAPGTLADIAPTVLRLMNIEQPAAMTGESLIL